MKLYIAIFPLSMQRLCFFVNIGENLVPFMEINTLINVKKINSQENNYNLKTNCTNSLHITQVIHYE